MVSLRRPVAITCIALVAFAAILPLGGIAMDWLALPATYVLLPPAVPSVITGEPVRSAEQTDALLAILEPRGPPASRLPA